MQLHQYNNIDRNTVDIVIDNQQESIYPNYVDDEYNNDGNDIIDVLILILILTNDRLID